MTPRLAPGEAQQAAIIMPLQHLLDGAGAVRVFEQQAHALRSAGMLVLAVAIAPALSLHRDRSALIAIAQAELQRLGDSFVVVTAGKPAEWPNAALNAVAAKVRGRWPLNADLAVSRFVDVSVLQNRRVSVVICNYIQGIAAADALADASRQIIVLHDIDPGPVPQWLAPLMARRGAVTALNPEEVRRLRSAGIASALLPPFFAPAAHLHESDGEAKFDLLFVGGSHPPNVAGLRAFLSGCFFPYLADQGFLMAIAGEAGPIAAPRQGLAGLTCLGRVDDTAPIYRTARLVVCPLLAGTGSSIKCAEALSAGKPVLGTPAAWRGYSIDQATSLSPPFDQRWAHRITQLIESRPAREDLFRAGARAITPGAGTTTLLHLVERVVKQ